MAIANILITLTDILDQEWPVSTAVRIVLSSQGQAIDIREKTFPSHSDQTRAMRDYMIEAIKEIVQ